MAKKAKKLTGSNVQAKDPYKNQRTYNEFVISESAGKMSSTPPKRDIRLGTAKKQLGGMGGGKPLKSNGTSAQSKPKAQLGKTIVPPQPNDMSKRGYRSMNEQIVFRKKVKDFNKTSPKTKTVKEKPIVTNQTVTPAKKYGGININPANKGKFTATKKATGKTTEQLTHSKNPVTKKRAVFAANAKKWNKKK